MPTDDEPWGVTSSSAQFRAFEPAEMRNCRSGPSHVKTCLQPVGPPPRRGVAPSRVGSEASAKTYKSGESANRSLQATGGAGKPVWSMTHQNPMPQKHFVATTANQENEANALAERQRHFPYRDEFAPRSKRLLYEMALQRCSRDDCNSASSMADDLSCFTLASTAASGRSASTPSLASRVPTADSQRLTCTVAKRRKELELRAPNQCAHDAAWLRKISEEEGPAGLNTANYSANYHASTLQKSGERILSMTALMDGRVDHEMRQRPS